MGTSLLLGWLGLLWALTLKATLAWGRTDNGWDNAWVHTLWMGLALWAGGLALTALGGPWALVLLPGVAAASHTAGTSFIYRLKMPSAARLCALHGGIYTFAAGLSLLAFAAVGAWLWYGRIITDPTRMLRLLMQVLKAVLSPWL